MNLTEYSHARLIAHAKRWEVPRDFSDTMLNYLAYGYEPGSCFTSVLANDFYGAIRHSHPSNTVESFKALTGWIHEVFPLQSYGDYPTVGTWCRLDTDIRRAILEDHNLIYTEKEETWMLVKGVPVHEVVI